MVENPSALVRFQLARLKAKYGIEITWNTDHVSQLFYYTEKVRNVKYTGFKNNPNVKSVKKIVSK